MTVSCFFSCPSSHLVSATTLAREPIDCDSRCGGQSDRRLLLPVLPPMMPRDEISIRKLAQVSRGRQFHLATLFADLMGRLEAMIPPKECPASTQEKKRV